MTSRQHHGGSHKSERPAENVTWGRGGRGGRGGDIRRGSEEGYVVRVGRKVGEEEDEGRDWEDSD